MSDRHTPDLSDALPDPHASQQVGVSKAQLPLCCPLPGCSQWNGHPRIFLPIREEPGAQIVCPYCGTRYVFTA